MGMSVGSPEGEDAVNSAINTTPLVDVMLVLLIIFMVITPMLSKGTTVELTKAASAIAMKEADAEDAILEPGLKSIIAATKDRLAGSKA